MNEVEGSGCVEVTVMMFSSLLILKLDHEAIRLSIFRIIYLFIFCFLDCIFRLIFFLAVTGEHF